PKSNYRARPRFRLAFFEPLEERSLLAAVITVNSVLDTNARDSALTLREAMLISNRTLAMESLTADELAQVSGTPTSTDTDTIAFNIPGSGVRTIGLNTSLPTVGDPVTIDGYTQPNAIPNTNGLELGPTAKGSNATLQVEISKVSGTISKGFNIDAND